MTFALKNLYERLALGPLNPGSSPFERLRPLFVLICCVAAAGCKKDAETEWRPTSPPYSGTIFISANIITASEPTSFISATARGIGLRRMFDRRVNQWVDVNAYLFDLDFGFTIVEAQVNPEFTSTEAAALAATYGAATGRIPRVLFSRLNSIAIHRGLQPFGGGSGNLLIHTGQAEVYQTQGILEEVLVHEACHVSLDVDHADHPEWKSAQKKDPVFISTYAKDFPDREDIAESFLPYYALRFKKDNLTAAVIKNITAAMPNRIAYFDSRVPVE